MMIWTTDAIKYTPPVRWTRETHCWEQIIERIFDKVIPVPESGCWIWLGATKGDEEYGCIYIGGKRFTIHKLVYELFCGKVPDELVLDHLCRVRPCINYHHLEPVTDAVNIYRGNAPGIVRMGLPECINGHTWTFKNTRIYDGKRVCRDCERERSARRKYVLDHN